MKTKYLFFSALVAMAGTAVAQETYENTRLFDNDLNGTARYVGMGGALEALGADISTISTNPAGVGLLRHSTVSTSLGFVSQSDAKKFAGNSPTTMSFDQIGLVYSLKTNENSFLNFSFNYHKSKNFDQLVDAANSLYDAERNTYASQNKVSYIKMAGGVFSSQNDATYSQVDHLYLNNLMYNSDDDKYYYYDADNFRFNRATEGYIGEYDFNVSGNIQNRLFLGVTFGIHDVHYKHYSEYYEQFTSNLDNIAGLTLADRREITGTGFDIKLGAILRPFDSPFRIGLYVHTPTWYDLTTENYTYLTDGYVRPDIGESYDFKVYTPWKFGVSLGHTFGNMLAVGATYEYADYSKTKSRINTDGFYDGWGDYYDDSDNDVVMNRHTENTLKGVSTVKLGLEFKPVNDFAIRLGYNYLSPLYESSGYRDVSLWSPGTYYASGTDYTNWKHTNRITVGLGYTYNKFNFDLAYQYSATNGQFHPFVDSDYTEPASGEGTTAQTIYNYAPATKVKNNQNQVLLTIGYTF